VIDFPGLIRFVFFKGIKNAQPLCSAPSRQVCTSVNSAKRVAMERRRKSRSRNRQVKGSACALSNPALMVFVVYHSCRQKSSEKCRGVSSSSWGKKAEGAISAPARRRPCSPPSPSADGQSSPPSSSHLHTSTSQGGYDVPFQFHARGRIEARRRDVLGWQFASRPASPLVRRVETS